MVINKFFEDGYTKEHKIIFFITRLLIVYLCLAIQQWLELNFLTFFLFTACMLVFITVLVGIIQCKEFVVFIYKGGDINVVYALCVRILMFIVGVFTVTSPLLFGS